MSIALRAARFDASALVKRYIDEPGSDALLQYWRARATKYTTPYKTHEIGKNSHNVNYFGNHKRSLHVSVRDSLKKLKTDWIDILYLHWWDHSSSIPEIMDSLHMLVQQGKVLYLGMSSLSTDRTPSHDHRHF